MNGLERFKAVVKFERPDYMPIFAFPGAPGVSWGIVQEPTRLRLVEQGMPEWVGKCEYDRKEIDNHWQQYIDHDAHLSWNKYWGTTGPTWLTGFPADASPGLVYDLCKEGDYEVIKYETGAITRQVINNDITYSMPEFREFHVRDRKSWEFYKERTAPGPMWPEEKIALKYSKYMERTEPLCLAIGSTYGFYRDLVGLYNASVFFYDDPELVHEIINWEHWLRRTYMYPLIQKLKPEILLLYEDCCYNKGMLLSPDQFRAFCSPIYREISEIGKSAGADLLAVDCDGNVNEYIGLLEESGFNGLSAFEQKACNNILDIRQKHPRFIIMGGLEKEVVNEGNEYLIREEILAKVPVLIEKGGYFPNNDHSIQPSVTFENLCKFMTLLHEVTGNPEGDFPRVQI